MNKDFLKEVLTEEKQLLELSELKSVIVPDFDELSVISLWPKMQDDPLFLSYFPSKLPAGRLPDRKYFFNIMNTLMPDYLKAITHHANEMRNTAKNEGMADAAIEITEKWHNKLMAIPALSRKYPRL